MKDLFIKIIFLSVIIAALSMSLLTHANAEISVEDYCHLCIKSMQQEISNFQELISLVNQYGKDSILLAEKEKIKQNEFKQAKDILFASFGTDGAEYVTFMGKHERKVNTYLENHLDIKQQIDELATQINLLLEEYESLKGH